MADIDRVQLARQELARRELAKRQQVQEPQLSQVSPEQYGLVGRAFTRPPLMPALPMQERFEQGLGRGIGAGINALGFNLPNAVMRKLGVDILPPATTPEQKAGEFAGTIGGTIVSPITKAGLAIGKVPQTARLLTKISRGALGGATIGGAYTPTEDIIGAQERTTGAIGGGLVGALTPTIVAYKRYLNPKTQLKIAENARNNLWSQKQAIIEKYGNEYNRIVKDAQGNVNLGEPLRELLENTDDAINTISGIEDFNKALAQKDTSAKRLLDLIKNFQNNPEIPMDISIQEANNLQKYIKNLPNIRTKLARSTKMGFEQVDWTNSERILLDFANSLKSNILQSAPEMMALNKEYGQFMTNFKRIRPYLKWDKAITTFKTLDFKDPAVKDMLVNILPKNIIKEIMSINRVEKAHQLLRLMGIEVAKGAGLGIGGYAIYKSLGGR